MARRRRRASLIGPAIVVVVLFLLFTHAGGKVFGSTAALAGGTTPGSMSGQQVEAAWIAAGGPGGAVAYNMARIAYMESGDRPGAVQPGEPPGLTGWGLWQITPTSGIWQGGQFGNLLNAHNNARAAVYLFRKNGYHPWCADPVGRTLTSC